MSIQSLEIRTLVSMKNMKQKKMVIQPLYLFSQPVRELVHIYLKIKKAQAMHRLYVQEKGFILTQDLKVGDPLLGLKKVSPNLSRLIRLLSFYKIFADMSI